MWAVRHFYLTKIQKNGILEGAKINNSIFLLLLKGRADSSSEFAC